MSEYNSSVGGTVNFPDGSQVHDPYQDNLGYVYENHDDYVHGENQHEATSYDGSDDEYHAEDAVDDTTDDDHGDNSDDGGY